MKLNNETKTRKNMTNCESKIMVKSRFYGWKNISYQKALEYAKWKILAITTTKNKEESLKMVNDCLNGIKFSLNDLT